MESIIHNSSYDKDIILLSFLVNYMEFMAFECFDANNYLLLLVIS